MLVLFPKESKACLPVKTDRDDIHMLTITGDECIEKVKQFLEFQILVKLLGN